MKRGKSYQTDEQLKRRCTYFKKYFFSKSDKNYIKFDGYYVELRKVDGGAGIRWFHRDKYKVEVVFDRESGPAQNVAGFVLFSDIDDAILHACLCETSALSRIAQQKRGA